MVVDMKLSEWADPEGIPIMTACSWWRAGTLPVPAHQAASGSILVDVAPYAPERSRCARNRADTVLRCATADIGPASLGRDPGAPV